MLCTEHSKCQSVLKSNISYSKIFIIFFLKWRCRLDSSDVDVHYQNICLMKLKFRTFSLWIWNLFVWYRCCCAYEMHIVNHLCFIFLHCWWWSRSSIYVYSMLLLLLFHSWCVTRAHFSHQKPHENICILI